jgi:hydrogenase nickel incorporation protein HypA/HybF
MHELSIAKSLVELATEHAANAGADKITSLTLRIGALSCVHRRALEFSFELVTKDSILNGAELRIIDVPVTVFCVPCGQEVRLPGIQSFRCPICNTPSADIRAGKELDLDSIEIVDKLTLEVIENG